ncbi:MAG: FeoA family protein [Acidobacteriota bacterium]|nr:FeoA family protein [Acidobacteriota bacterium]
MRKIIMRQMKESQTGTITAIKVKGELGRRIRDMGLVPGTTVTIQGRAPLYDPVAIKVMGLTARTQRTRRKTQIATRSSVTGNSKTRRQIDSFFESRCGSDASMLHCNVSISLSLEAARSERT